MKEDPSVLLTRFLARASRFYGEGEWVFTGFHWPVLAMAVARLLRSGSFDVAFEAGAVVRSAGSDLPTSTTDFASYPCSWVGGSSEALLSLGRRYDRAILDASNVDVRGAINSTRIEAPSGPLRLAGGGGAADIAASASELVLLHGRTDLSRFVREVECATALPRGSSQLVTPWALMILGAEPRVTEWLVVPPPEDVVATLSGLGIVTSSDLHQSMADDELEAARSVLRQAASRGYRVAQEAGFSTEAARR